MKLLSLNGRGLKNHSKRLTVKRLVLMHQPHVIFLQETLCLEVVIVPILKASMLHWDFMGVDSKGHPMGLVLGWNTSKIKVKSVVYPFSLPRHSNLSTNQSVHGLLHNSY
jgi:hypothetical protein